MNRHARRPLPPAFKEIGKLAPSAPSALEREIIDGMAEEILTLGVPLSDSLRIATRLAERGFLGMLIDLHLDAAIAQATARHERQAT